MIVSLRGGQSSVQRKTFENTLDVIAPRSGSYQLMLFIQSSQHELLSMVRWYNATFHHEPALHLNATGRGDRALCGPQMLCASLPHMQPAKIYWLPI